MIQLAAIFGAPGVLLLIVALVRGGFTFSGTVMPTVGKAARLACFIVGCVLVLGAIGFGVNAASNNGNNPNQNVGPNDSGVSPQPAVGRVAMAPGLAAKTFADPSLSSGVRGTLESGTEVEIVCTAQGDVVQGVSVASSLWDKLTDGSFIPDANVDTLTNQPTMPQC